MLRHMLIGLWACLATVGATYGAVYMRLNKSAASATAEHAEKMTVRKVRPLTVPIISEGALKGYVSAEFSLVTAEGDPHGHEQALDPESFFLDEAFRLIYGETKIDFANIQKTDLNDLTARLTTNVNKRMGKAIVKETLLRNMTFVAREDLPK